MSDVRSRKRKANDAEADCSHEHGRRCSRRCLRSRAAENGQNGTQSSSSEPSTLLSPTSPSSAAPATQSHGLKTVNLLPGEHEVAGCLVSGSETMKEFTFFSFPGELRNMIYNYSLHYPDGRRLYAQYYQRSSINEASPKWQPRLRAPTILLLNKRITNECLPILKSTKLVIDRLPPPRTGDIHQLPLGYLWGYPSPSYFMRLSDFLSPRALQTIPQIDINVGLCEGPLGSGWAWKRVVDEVLEILTQRNACVKLRLLFRLCNIHIYRNVWHSDEDDYIQMIKKINEFASVNPNVFARREVKTEEWLIEGHKATYLKGESYPRPSMVVEDGSVEEFALEEAVVEKEPVPSPRMYPDREMFPGSVMEFVRPAPPPFLQ